MNVSAVSGGQDNYVRTVCRTRAARRRLVLTIALPGEDIKTGEPIAFKFTTSGAADPLVVDGTGSAAACSPVLPKDDGLKLVFFRGPGIDCLSTAGCPAPHPLGIEDSRNPRLRQPDSGPCCRCSG